MSLGYSAFFISERGDALNESIELTANKRNFQKNEGEKYMSTAINLNELMKLYEGEDVEITLIIPSSPLIVDVSEPSETTEGKGKKNDKQYHESE